MGFSASVLATLPPGCTVIPEDHTDELLRFVSDSPLPVDATRTGTLATEAFDALAGLCEYVNRAWELTPDLGPYRERLEADLGLKAGHEPSYLTEYENAVELVDLLVSSGNSAEQTWSSLLFAEVGADLAGDAFAHSKLGRARTFVFSEIVTHQVPLSEGFRSFGLSNYRGHFGGSFTEAGSYRRGGR